MRHAEQNGWGVIEERQQISESHSVDVSSELLRRQGACAVLLLPADIPLVQPEDVDFLLSREPEWRSSIIVPSQDGTGTNALLRTPPDAFPSRFGKDSFFLHRKEASCRKIQVKVIENPRISLDLDELSDLLRFCRLETGTRTAEVLEEVGCLKALLKSK
jgi:2-phospho-L-lactate guanylyltransferase